MRSHIVTCFKASGRLCAAAFWLLLLFAAPTAADEGAPGDEYLTGYVVSILERELHWNRVSYRLEVLDGVATVTLLQEDPARREAAQRELRTVEWLKEVTITVAPTDSEQLSAESGKAEKKRKGRAYPSGDLFRPLLADPKQPQFFASVGRFKSQGTLFTMAESGFGETFGLYRFSSAREGDGLQLSVEASLVARFDMSTASSDLINADYTLGLPLTYRHGASSIRFRVYHQSSHLGDEFLQSANPPDRVNLSYEAVEFLYSLEGHGLRGYAGGEYLIRQDPKDLAPGSAHWGIEYRGSSPLFWRGRPLVAVDWKSFEEHAWAIDTSVKAGLEFGQPNPGHRRLRLMAEWYQGFDPRGQFYMNKVNYFGLNVSLGF